VFDPFYTTKSAEQGAGMGLSICYGIVREHGGEISAFNLHPHGAAVVLELPVGRVVTGEERVLVRAAGEEQGVTGKVRITAG
jgi:signal transduction histidine kinase